MQSYIYIHENYKCVFVVAENLGMFFYELSSFSDSDWHEMTKKATYTIDIIKKIPLTKIGE